MRYPDITLSAPRRCIEPIILANDFTFRDPDHTGDVYNIMDVVSSFFLVRPCASYVGMIRERATLTTSTFDVVLKRQPIVYHHPRYLITLLDLIS